MIQEEDKQKEQTNRTQVTRSPHKKPLKHGRWWRPLYPIHLYSCLLQHLLPFAQQDLTSVSQQPVPHCHTMLLSFERIQIVIASPAPLCHTSHRSHQQALGPRARECRCHCVGDRSRPQVVFHAQRSPLVIVATQDENGSRISTAPVPHACCDQVLVVQMVPRTIATQIDPCPAPMNYECVEIQSFLLSQHLPHCHSMVWICQLSPLHQVRTHVYQQVVPLIAVVVAVLEVVWTRQMLQQSASLLTLSLEHNHHSQSVSLNCSLHTHLAGRMSDPECHCRFHYHQIRHSLHHYRHHYDYHCRQHCHPQRIEMNCCLALVTVSVACL